jgi:asparagine synthase (glutamine-hydrolysing)
MCGILALIRESAGPASTQPIVRSTRIVRHRGPDDEGYFLWSKASGGAIYADEDTARSTRQEKDLRPLPAGSDWTVAFGHRRLSIVDLSSAGHQPMTHRATGVTINYNGEIYNHVELRAELEREGHTFESHCDTEVLLVAWVHWGPAALSRLNGMFSFVLFDPRDGGTVHAVRDRFGVKPLYWARVGDVIALGSEIKQIRALPGFTARLDESAASDYLAHGLVDHTSRTLDAGIQQLRGGERLEVRLAGRPLEVEKHRWYHLTPRASASPSRAAADLRELLADSVRLRLRADVPIGSCLSGGLDSSAIVCLARRALRDHGTSAGQITVTARFSDPRFDEWQFARLVIEQTGANSVEVWPSFDRLRDELDRQLWFMDDPFGSTSMFSQYCVFEGAAGAGLKVMLDGQGSDEMLAGYGGSDAPLYAGLMRRGSLLHLGREVLAFRQRQGAVPLSQLVIAARNVFPALDALLPARVRAHPPAPHWLRTTPALEAPLGASRDLRTHLEDQLLATSLPALLRYEDRNSMAWSIESRVPFLDYRLVEYVAGLADELKFHRGLTKVVLRDALTDVVPERVRTRRDKMGFVTPEREWLRGEGRSWFLDGVREAADAAPSLIDGDAIVRETEEIAEGRRAFSFMPWRVLCFGRWLKLTPSLAAESAPSPSYAEA